ncbi:DNA repair protein RecN [Neobacillus piezotolerans]|uniref:DNA repair protein RecN n=1 Tax=Neobacillus piezotolerans TaxID=2259171 RepID=A0A3D8GLA3_9BACI|nr:DNA repair protein RecN [Neobacillus piezotolerans]RDU35178.1 DNA repair protein RecN [Neobacillus piezotolerans]
MLTELSIKNFAIIEALSVSFSKGLTVLTGETGAGKSIIIDAIHLLVGGRGSSEFVRHGEDKAEIEGLFLLDDTKHPCFSKTAEYGIDMEDSMVVLRRDINQNGKSVCRVNGKLVTLSVLREIGGTLVDIHGQHEHQELMNEALHLSLLDQFGNNGIQHVLKSYQRVFGEYEETIGKLRRLSENEQQMAHRLDLIQFQYEEISNANLKKAEDEELAEEKQRLVNFEKIFESVQSSYNALKGDSRALDWAGEAMGMLEGAAALDPDYKETFEAISNSYYMLEDAASNLRNKLDILEYDPERLNEIEARLTEINQLKRKYGKTIPEILLYAEKIHAEIDALQNKETHIGNLEKQLSEFKKQLSKEASELTSVRKKWAEKLEKLIHKELKDLYMAKTVFEIRFLEEGPHYTRMGADKVEFFISTNPGEPLKPLSKVASGGELSRIMLALKSIFSKHQGVTSIIFDEVDTGVSGRVAQAIAEKISRVAAGSQVLCISHLPQVAAMADTHLLISKVTKGGRTKTTVVPLNEVEKVAEIGRMISGVEITDLTKEHAKELLVLAAKIKNT